MTLGFLELCILHYRTEVGFARRLRFFNLQGDATAATKFQEASKAYETLKDPQKRAMYDRVNYSDF